MKKLLLCLLISSSIYAQESQKTTTYKYGYNGMELIASCKKGTVIISTFNSKEQIKSEIAQKIYSLYLENKVKHNALVTIKGDDADVIGRFTIRKKGTLTAINFYYEKVSWYSGLTEVYKKNII
jgi:hypothetical protein